MDLQTLQGQLKTAIQNHQIVVSKMRNDPQNISLKKQLHDLQAEIMTLSEKQKQVVQQLRKELEKKQQVVIVTGSNQLPANQSPLLHSTLTTQRCTQSLIVTQPMPVQTQAVALTNKQMTIVQSGPQTVRHVVPSVLSSLVTSSANLSIKAPVATAVLLSHGATATNALLAARSSSQQRTQPVLVVPSPNSRPNEASQASVMLNLAPPIRVPQYPPPGSRPVLTVPTACHSITTTTTTTSSSSLSSSHSTSQRTPSSPHIVIKPLSSQNKVVNKEKQVKTDFMSTLGLVTKDFLTELRSRKSERKRRTTANPQFSNAALEEKRKNAAFLNAENAQGPPIKRPRGRPRLAPPTPNSSRSLSPENNIASSITIAPLSTSVSTKSVIAAPTDTATTTTTTSTTTTTTTTTTATTAAFTTITTIAATCTASTTISTNSPMYSNGGNSVVNGYHLPQQSLVQHPAKETPQEQCTVCKQKGNMLKCSVCLGLFHSSCLQSPVLVAPTGSWTCTKCSKSEIKPRVTTWSSPLSVVHSYIALKAVKEEEKRKLLKRSLELKSERTQLKDRMQQLNEVINDQAKRRTDLQATYQIMQKSIECLQDFITKTKQMS